MAENIYQLLMDNLTDSVFILLDERFRFANRAAIESWGFTKEEILSPDFDLLTLVHPDCQDLVIENERQRRKGKDIPRYEVRMITKSGDIKEVLVKNIAMIYEGKPAIAAILADITERKQAEDALREAEELYRTIIDAGSTAKDGFALVQDIDGIEAKHVYVNDYYAELTGYTKEELQQISGHDMIHPGIKDVVIDRYRGKMAGEDLPSYNEFEWVRKEGGVYTVGLSSAVTTFKGEPAFLYYFRDITEEKKMQAVLDDYRLHLEELVSERTLELEEAYEQLRRGERLATIGELAGSFAHEIRNPLGAIKNSAYYLDMVLASRSEKVDKHLFLMQQEISRIDKLITDLLDFSRVKTPIKEDIIIENLINSAIEKVNIPAQIEVRLKSHHPARRFCADYDQLERVFLNLLTNAVDAIEDGGMIEIRIRDEEEMVIMVSDTGCGINKDMLDKISEPLYTTKVQGVGLGLSICRQIVEAHGGEVESDEGAGTTFVMKFPRVTLNE